MGRPARSKNKNFHRFSDEEKEYLINNHKGKSYKEIAFNMRKIFNYEFTHKQIQSAMKRYNLKNGLDTRFKSGNISWNKGTKGLTTSNKTSFAKGTMPPNHRPVGSERIDKDGFIIVKVKEPRTWKHKHRYIYEQNIGEIKKGNVVIFLDGNNRNFNTDNLMQTTRSQLLILNKYKLITCNSDLTKVGINTANLIIKLNEIKKGKINK